MARDGSGAALRSIHALFAAGTVGGLADGQLLDRFAARDGEAAELAFAALVERHGPMVLRVCRGVLRDVHDAEDAFQATFLILARKAGSIRRRDALAPWLHGVAFHVASTARTAAARRRSHEMKAGQSRPQAMDGSAWDDLGPVVHEELARLPGHYRAAVVLCCLEGLTQQQAAQRLGWPLGTVQSRLARGRERLRIRLSRRVPAPSAALPVALLSAEAERTAVPAALANTTARLASGAAQALATGAVPVAVITLAEEVMRTMFLNKLKTTCVAALLAAGFIATGAAVSAYQDAGPDPADARAGAEVKPGPPAVTPSNAGFLTVTGTVLMPDGSPAAGATVESTSESDEAPAIARTDDAGRFQLHGVFGNGGRLHVRSADGNHQATLGVSPVAVRTAFASPVEMTLSPALTHEVTILSDGRPVEDAHVAAVGDDFEVHGLTNQDGKVVLRLPARGRLREMVAWHPKLGVNGVLDVNYALPLDRTRLSLLAPGPHRIRVVDPDGNPIAGLEFGVSFRTEDSDWIVAHQIEAAHVRTDADGVAIVPWAPREKLKYVGVELIGTDWKIDETELARITEGVTTVHARRERTVEGRLVMPEGANAEGLLITGFGFGPGTTGDTPYARARRDGTFTLRVPSDHAYVLGITDLKWASDPWSGMILGKETWKPAEITMNVYPATSLTARVTRGPRRDPVANAWVELSSRGEVAYIDAKGEKRTGSGGVSGWLTTDAKGVVRAGVGKGNHELRLSSGSWKEERAIKVTSTEPIEVEFHRPWQGDRRITGRLMLDGAPYTPSPTLVARAWTPQSPAMPLQFEPKVHPDGTFQVAFDAESLSLFFIDREKQRSGFARIGQGDSTVEVTMEAATASYSGVLLDENAQPMVGRTLQLHVKASTYEAVAAQQADKAGRFRFAGVPANVPLQMDIRNEGNSPEYYLFDRDRMFKPGEVRENDRVKPRRGDSLTPIARPSIPLTKRVEGICRDARSTGMHALVVLLGDDSQNVVTVADQLLDYSRVKAVLSYLTLRVDAVLLQTEAVTLAEHGWPRPAPGEIVLVVLDGDRKTIAAERVATDKMAAAVAIADDFLKRHMPPTRDARALLTAARKEAKGSSRRVWIVHGGPRCGPCFLLARWMEDHRTALEKDYVIVKVMDGLDAHAAEVIAELPRKDEDGVPWFAITEPDGAILATSGGPLGNIGCPSSVEGIRHFRQMLDRTVQRLTAKEVDGLIKSLSPEP